MEKPIPICLDPGVCPKCGAEPAGILAAYYTFVKLKRDGETFVKLNETVHDALSLFSRMPCEVLVPGDENRVTVLCSSRECAEEWRATDTYPPGVPAVLKED